MMPNKLIACACGCGITIEPMDRWGRSRKFVSGHNGRKYSDPKQYKREWNYRNRERRRKTKAAWIRERKAELILLHGGKCSACGLKFDGCSAVFDFHHKRPRYKKFNINNASLNKYSFAKMKQEAKKCLLLCANCHRRLHWDD